MPVTINLPLPDHPVGPGFGYSLSSDFIGPLGQDAYFQLTVFGGASNEVTLLSERRIVQQPFGSFNWLDLLTDSSGIVHSATVGSTVQLRADLHDTTGAVVDSGQIAATWQPEQGIGSQIWQRGQTTVQGGFTAADRQLLTDVSSAVQRAWADFIGVAITTPIGSALSHPETAFYFVDPTCVVLEGEGVIDHPGLGAPVSAFGLLLTAVQVPGGFGRLDGWVDRYEQRLAQLVAVYRSSSQTIDHNLEVFELYLGRQTWIWRDVGPHHVAFHVTPGVQVQACWIVARL